MRWLIGAFFINPAKETIAKVFFTMLFNYLCEIDKYTLLLLFVLVFFFCQTIYVLKALY